jgi:hypothetical protein
VIVGFDIQGAVRATVTFSPVRRLRRNWRVSSRALRSISGCGFATSVHQLGQLREPLLSSPVIRLGEGGHDLRLGPDFETLTLQGLHLLHTSLGFALQLSPGCVYSRAHDALTCVFFELAVGFEPTT